MNAIKKSILYVDDESSNLSVFKKLFRRNFNVITCESAEEGLKIFEAGNIELIISDQRMPGMKGLKFLEVVRQKNSFIPTILLSGYQDYDVLRDAVNEVGVNKLISKPFDYKNLLITIESLITTYQLQLENNGIQAKLAASENEYRGIFESFSDVFIRTDLEGKILLTSPSIKDLLGYNPCELEGKNILEFLKNFEFSHTYKKKKTPKITILHSSIIAKDGSHKHIASSAKLYFSNTLKRELGYELLWRDVTEQHNLQQEILEKQLFLNEAQKMAQLGSWQWTIGEEHMIWSDLLFDIYQIKKKKDNKVPFSSFLGHFFEEDIEDIKKKISRVEAKKKNISFETRIRRPNGEFRTISTWIKHILPEENSGDKTKVIASCMDITESKRKEKEIFQSREDFRLLSENSTSRIFKVNRDFEIEYANKLALEELIKSKKKKPVFLDFFKSDIQETIITSINSVFAKEEPTSLEIDNSQDEETWFSIDFVPLHSAQRLLSVLVIINDISVKKRVEGMLWDINHDLEQKVQKRTLDLERTKSDLEIAYAQEKNLNKLRSQFVSTASHQFRTPLTVIQSNFGLLEMHLRNESPEVLEQFNKVSKRINSEIKRMTDLMDNVLILGKRDSGTLKVKPQMIDVLGLCKKIVGKYAEIQSDNRQASISHSGSPSLYFLDPELFDDAFSNLVSNAYKYSAGSPPPEIKLTYKKGELRIDVRDFGVGIPEEDLPSLFEPFYRGSNVRDFNGTGLGTSIVKTYIEMLDGEVQVESKLNEGTKFTLLFKN